MDYQLGIVHGKKEVGRLVELHFFLPAGRGVQHGPVLQEWFGADFGRPPHLHRVGGALIKKIDLTLGNLNAIDRRGDAALKAILGM